MKYLILFICLLSLSETQNDVVYVEKSIYSVTYSQKLEQPLEVIYRSTNRPTKVNNKKINFHSEKGIHTSNNDDYVNNIYDKGHLVPAATFSDNISNLRETFSYLNCSLQNQYLNRGEWKSLEEQERLWDNIEPLTIKITVIFDENSIKLSTGATVPSGFKKEIFFEKSKKYKCYFFSNEKPKLKWYKHNIICK